MRLQHRFFNANLRSLRHGLLLFCGIGALSAASAQVAPPYVLPYTMSTFAGPHAQYSAGTACGNYIALDGAGDGCLATAASIGADPHDIRVDGQGNVFWIDNNASTAIIHKISAVSGRMTAYVGSTVDTSICTGAASTQGDGCLANDGAANAGPKITGATYYTAKTPKARGLGIGANGDLFYADYNGSYDHKVSAATGYLSIVAGSGSANASNPPATGQPGSSQVNASRGIGVDPNGNVWIADTGDGNLRVVPSGVGSVPGVASPVAGFAYNLTVYNPSTINAKTVVSGIPIAQVVLNSVEDVQSDSNGNIYIADTGNAVVRVLYSGKGNIPGVVNPQAGYAYVIAGYNALYSTVQNTYPKDGTTPTFPATTIAISDRKIALDTRNNLYIADSSNNVVWFVDNATGNIRLLAGSYGATAGAAAVGCSASAGNTIGDGCPGSLATLFAAADMGTDPDNQGNLYITDAENGNASNSRLRKLLSGLNFPATAKGSSVKQTVLVHFGPGDTVAAANGFVIKAASSGFTDYTLGTPTCVTQTDTTSDCQLPITFTPVQPGYDTATLAITSLLGGTISYQLTGTSLNTAIVIDPGSVSVLNSTVSNPQGIVVDGMGNTYTVDTGHNQVLITSPLTSATTVFAGTGTAGYTGDAGLATAATLKAPRAVAVDTSGSVYIADTGNNVIRKVSVAGVISTYAGGATTACTLGTNTRGDGCPATQATFNAPSGLAADNLGVLYVADTGNNVIRAIGVLGDVSTLAGGAASFCSGTTDVFGDGCSANLTVFKAPTGLAFDATGNNLIVADTGDNIVRKIYLANTIVSAQTTPGLVSTVVFNPVTLIAGTGAAGNVLDNNNTGILSQLNGPTGVAIGPAQNVYIADTGNSAIRLVSPSGLISTIVGVLGASGTGTVPGSAASVQLASPAAVAVNAQGVLQIADSGNARILTDQRSQVSFNFGRTNQGFSSPAQTFIESSIGTVGATLPNPLLTQSATQTQFTLVPVSGGTGCGSGTFAIGATCILQGQFTPTQIGNFSTTFTEVGSNVVAGDPAITLIGVGAVLTKTTAVVVQSAPTGSSQFGATATMTATITPASCNTAAPNCYPTGTVRFIVDGGNPGAPIAVTGSGSTASGSQVISGLAVGNHTVACNYSGDNFYAASSCGTITITVTQGGTTSLLTVTNNGGAQYNNCFGVVIAKVNYTQCGTTILTASVISNTIATAFPTGSVNFYVGTTLLGTGQVDATSGIATFTLAELLGSDGNPVSDNTLIPGTYTLSCKYSGSANFAVSNCAGVTFTVVASPVSFSLTPRGCQLTSLDAIGTSTPSLGVACAAPVFNSGFPQVDTAQGSTTDASIFITPSNTLSGTLTFSCSGVPQFGTCTFLPTSITLTASTAPASPVATDMTLWTDIKPGQTVGSLRTGSGGKNGTYFALVAGGPMLLLGFAGVLGFRRKLRGKALNLVAMLLLLAGSSMMLSSCAGPGSYVPSLTPAGTYPITVTVTGAGITKTTTVYFVVGAPGLLGQQ